MKTKHLRSFSAVLPAFLLGMGASALTGMRTSPGSSDDIRARSFSVLSKKGDPVIVMGLNASDQPEIRFMDPDGPSVARISIRLDVFGTPVIELLDPLDPKSDAGAKLVLTNEGEPGAPELRLWSSKAKGTDRALLTIQMNRSGKAGLQALDRGGKTLWEYGDTK
jgi:hypothetical protein